MGMWLDAETPEEQRTTESLMNVFISGKSIRYGDDGDSPTPGGTDRTEVADNAKITSIFSEIMKTTKNPVVLGVQEN